MVEKHFVSSRWIWVQLWGESEEAQTSFQERQMGVEKPSFSIL